MILVTGAAGQVGTALVRHLGAAGHAVLPSDTLGAVSAEVVPCDLRSEQDVARLFENRHFSTIVHLAAVLPTAFRSDPLAGGEVNLSGTVRLLRAAVDSGVQRFVFGSSASVYGHSERPPCSEATDPSPGDPYGASKLAIEKILEQISCMHPIETVSLRIPRVLGPGAKRTGSPWRSQIFENPVTSPEPLSIPFAADAGLSVIHVEDLARALQILIEASTLPHRIYNAPTERISAGEIRRLAELKGWRVCLGTSQAGPEIVCKRFNEVFRFVARPISDYLSVS
jgi:nucleoside-diphosphate-sugar epimerase